MTETAADNGNDKKKLIGSGSFGNVYEVTGPERTVVKEMKREYNAYNEISLLLTYSHPNIPVITKITNHAYTFEVHMAHGGKSLDEWIGSSQELLPHFPSVCCQILSVLAFLERENVSHGDLKPENVLINEAHKITVIDWGSSHANTLIYPNVNSDQLWNFGMCTSWFRAPEIINGLDEEPEKCADNKYGVWNDVYSLGVTFKYLVICVYLRNFNGKIFISEQSERREGKLSTNMQEMLGLVTPVRLKGLMAEMGLEDSFGELIAKMLETDHLKRIKASDALRCIMKMQGLPPIADCEAGIVKEVVEKRLVIRPSRIEKIYLELVRLKLEYCLSLTIDVLNRLMVKVNRESSGLEDYFMHIAIYLAGCALGANRYNWLYPDDLEKKHFSSPIMNKCNLTERDMGLLMMDQTEMNDRDYCRLKAVAAKIRLAAELTEKDVEMLVKPFCESPTYPFNDMGKSVSALISDIDWCLWALDYVIYRKLPDYCIMKRAARRGLDTKIDYNLLTKVYCEVLTSEIVNTYEKRVQT